MLEFYKKEPLLNFETGTNRIGHTLCEVMLSSPGVRCRVVERPAIVEVPQWQWGGRRAPPREVPRMLQCRLAQRVSRCQLGCLQTLSVPPASHPSWLLK